MNSHSRGTTQIALLQSAAQGSNKPMALTRPLRKYLLGLLPFSPQLKSDLKRSIFTGSHQTPGSLKKWTFPFLSLSLPLWAIDFFLS